MVPSYSNAPFRAGTSISTGSNYFGGSNHNERAGDFLITTGSCNQRILLGNVAGRNPCVVIDSNSVNVLGQVQANNLRLVLGDDSGNTSNAASYASNLYPAVSNAAFYASNAYPSLSNVAYSALESESDTHQVFKNRIINGDMRVNQREFNATASDISTYTLDRWSYDCVGDSTCAIGQSSIVPDGEGLEASLAQTFTASSTGAYGGLYQYIEGHNFIDFQWGTSYASSATLSFWIKMNLAGAMPLVVDYYGSAATYSYYKTFAYSTADAWQHVALTIPPPPTSAGAFSTSSSALSDKIVAIRFDNPASTNPNTVPDDTWSTITFAKNDGALNLGSLSWTRSLTGVQLEKGTSATPFDLKPYATELQHCQRYFYAMNTTTSGLHACLGVVASDSATHAKVLTNLPVTMRRPPTSLATSGTFSLFSSPAGAAVTSLALSDPSDQSVDSVVMRLTGSGLNTNTNTMYMLTFDSSPSALRISSEL